MRSTLVSVQKTLAPVLKTENLDSLGRRYCYSNHQRVPCGGDGEGSGYREFLDALGRKVCLYEGKRINCNKVPEQGGRNDQQTTEPAPIIDPRLITASQATKVVQILKDQKVAPSVLIDFLSTQPLKQLQQIREELNVKIDNESVNKILDEISDKAEEGTKKKELKNKRKIKNVIEQYLSDFEKNDYAVEYTREVQRLKASIPTFFSDADKNKIFTYLEILEKERAGIDVTPDLRDAGETLEQIQDKVNQLPYFQHAKKVVELENKMVLYNAKRLSKAIRSEFKTKKGDIVLRNLDQVDPKVASQYEEAAKFFKEVFGTKEELLVDIALEPAQADERSMVKVDQGVINVGGPTSWNQRTAFHEMAHVMESTPGTLDASYAFIEKRFGDQEFEDLADYGMPGEAGRDDDLQKTIGTLMGPVAAYYAGKLYTITSGDETYLIGTEIVSVGLEAFLKSPQYFYFEDPEYAEFIIGILAGTLRGAV